MRVCWFCIPAYGHTNPTLALVREMTRRGHEVYYFSFRRFREQIEQAGGRFIGCDDYEPEMKHPEQQDRVGTDVAFSMELLVSATLALDEMAMRTVDALRPDVIVSDSVAYWGKLVAMKCRIPYVCSTTTFAFNRASSGYIRHGLGEALNLLVSLPKVNRQIKRLQDRGYPVKGMLDIIQNDNSTNTIIYTSEYFQPCAETFPDKYCFIGPSIRPVQTAMKKTAETTIFLSMGTVVKKEAFFEACIDALKGTDYQVIVASGKSRVPAENLPDNIQVYEFVDQMAALAISDVFITHCGMNSASEGLYFGVPLILCPQTPEQAAVARRVEELGAGIRLGAGKKAGLLAAIDEILTHAAYQKAAAQISETFQKSGGAEKACAFLEQVP